MLILKNNDSRTAPILTCDFCHEPITNAGMALARYNYLKTADQCSEIYFCHKGRCDNELNKTIPDEATLELTHFFAMLLHNCGMTPETFEAANKSSERLERF